VGDDLLMDSLLSPTSWLATRDRAVLKLAIRHARCSSIHTNIAPTSSSRQQWRLFNIKTRGEKILKAYL